MQTIYFGERLINLYINGVNTAQITLLGVGAKKYTQGAGEGLFLSLSHDATLQELKTSLWPPAMLFTHYPFSHHESCADQYLGWESRKNNAINYTGRSFRQTHLWRSIKFRFRSDGLGGILPGSSVLWTLKEAKTTPKRLKLSRDTGFLWIWLQGCPFRDDRCQASS